GRGLSEALAQAGASRVDAKLPAGLRVDEPEWTDVRKLLLARIADLDGDHVVPRGKREQRTMPVVRPSEVGDEDDERSLSGKRRRACDAVGERRRLPLTAWFLVKGGEEPEQAHPSLARGQRLRIGSAEGHDPEAVATPRREVADRDGDALRDVRLPSVGGAELHRGGDIEHEPGDEH